MSQKCHREVYGLERGDVVSSRSDTGQTAPAAEGTSGVPQTTTEFARVFLHLLLLFAELIKILHSLSRILAAQGLRGQLQLWGRRVDFQKNKLLTSVAKSDMLKPRGLFQPAQCWGSLPPQRGTMAPALHGERRPSSTTDP